jgi:delta 1-pyrroline-5-carboxylate dehydrogenase
MSASKLAYECITYFAAHDSRVVMPVTQFMGIFRAAAVHTLQQVGYGAEQRAPLNSTRPPAAVNDGGVVSGAKSGRGPGTRQSVNQSRRTHRVSHTGSVPNAQKQQQQQQRRPQSAASRIVETSGLDAMLHDQNQQQEGQVRS